MLDVRGLSQVHLQQVIADGLPIDRASFLVWCLEIKFSTLKNDVPIYLDSGAIHFIFVVNFFPVYFCEINFVCSTAQFGDYMTSLKLQTGVFRASLFFFLACCQGSKPVLESFSDIQCVFLEDSRRQCIFL